jgi:hypothetical protein
LVVGSSPTGPTKILRVSNQFRLQLRGSCILSRSWFAIQTIHPVDIRTGNEVAIGIDRDLNRTVSHVILHVGDGLVGVEMSAEEIAESKRLRDKLERTLFLRY